MKKTNLSDSLSDDFFDDKDDLDDDFLKKKTLEYMSLKDDNEHLINNNSKATKNVDAIKKWAEDDSEDNDSWSIDEKDERRKDENQNYLENQSFKSPYQLLQEKIGISSIEPLNDSSFILNNNTTNNNNNLNIKHFEEGSDEEEDWFADDDKEISFTNDQSLEPIVKTGERASEINTQTKLHVKIDNLPISPTISSNNDIDVNDIQISVNNNSLQDLMNNNNNEGIKTTKFNSKLIEEDDDDSDPWFSEGSISPPKPFSHLIDNLNLSDNNIGISNSFNSNSMNNKLNNIDLKVVDEDESESDDWYSDEDEKDDNLEDKSKKKGPFANFFKDEEKKDVNNSSSMKLKVSLEIPKIGNITTGTSSGTGIGGITGQSGNVDTARRIKEAESLTLEELNLFLTDVTKLKETYLNLSNAETQQFYSKLLASNLKTQLLVNSSSINNEENSMNNSSNNINGQALPKEIEDTMPDATMLPSDWPTTLSFFQQKKGQGITVKLVYIESTQTPFPAKLYSPVLKYFGSKSKQLDAICSGLIIGPFLLHWNTIHSLVIPKKLVSDAYLCQTRTHRIAELFNFSLETIIDIIAKIIVDWNLKKVYDSHFRNCQHFVERIIEALGIKKVLDVERIGKILYNFNSNLIREGKANLEFNFSDIKQDKLYTALEKKYGTTKITFTTHEQLDEFMRNIISEDPNFTITHHQDYSLLVTFDQIFWAKHVLSPNDETYKPLIDQEKKHTSLCPFGKPTSL
ncbi:hypothetical protein ABK040_001294 [Willaertia magna]